jgi:hypothetical protein
MLHSLVQVLPDTSSPLITTLGRERKCGPCPSVGSESCGHAGWWRWNCLILLSYRWHRSGAGDFLHQPRNCVPHQCSDVNQEDGTCPGCIKCLNSTTLIRGQVEGIQMCSTPSWLCISDVRISYASLSLWRYWLSLYIGCRSGHIVLSSKQWSSWHCMRKDGQSLETSHQTVYVEQQWCIRYPCLRILSTFLASGSAECIIKEYASTPLDQLLVVPQLYTQTQPYW